MGIEVMTFYLVDFVHFLDEPKEVTTFEAICFDKLSMTLALP